MLLQHGIFQNITFPCIKAGQILKFLSGLVLHFLNFLFILVFCRKLYLFSLLPKFPLVDCCFNCFLCLIFSWNTIALISLLVSVRLSSYLNLLFYRHTIRELTRVQQRLLCYSVIHSFVDYFRYSLLDQINSPFCTAPITRKCTFAFH